MKKEIELRKMLCFISNIENNIHSLEDYKYEFYDGKILYIYSFNNRFVSITIKYDLLYGFESSRHYAFDMTDKESVNEFDNDLNKLFKTHIRKYKIDKLLN